MEYQLLSLLAATFVPLGVAPAAAQTAVASAGDATALKALNSDWLNAYKKGWSDDVSKAQSKALLLALFYRAQEKDKAADRKSRDAPTGPRLEDPGEYEWKKLIALYRS